MDTPLERLGIQRRRVQMRLEQARMDDNTEATMVLVNVLNTIDADIDREIQIENCNVPQRWIIGAVDGEGDDA